MPGPTPSKSGIQTTAEGASFIPSSQRPDGSTRKQIRVRPGYRPPEDVETYKNRNAEAWKNQGKGDIPGIEHIPTAADSNEKKSKNAKRREAARKKTEAAVEEAPQEDESLISAMQSAKVGVEEHLKQKWRNPAELSTNALAVETEEAERQKKIRNQLKKLKAIRELKTKKAGGEKLSSDQIMKISKEGELLRDLQKLDYEGLEISDGGKGIEKGAQNNIDGGHG